MSRPIRYIVLHYSATFEDQDITAADVRNWHKGQGFNDIGYHYFIRRNGLVEPGRPESVTGAHVRGHNPNSIGICCAGGLNRGTGPDVGVDNRTDAQKTATVNLLKDILTRYPDAQVVGHKDLVPTQCPGFDVRSWWATAKDTKPLAAEPSVSVWQAIVRFIDALTRRLTQPA
ncbi:N-acetylmuramoyl-L-alanine amidase [Paracoccus sp. (in: a-proteobacteria)]|uniref:N-acetylmuramoyl-L-alanine amidase n=1 Tax=Paracoccus sp. TaxID=267 RepID=UPI0026DFC1E6|nr:N-acetylmuramoyl-L-alanine amidase [Paracoccus sp. (in: a-proteobacteria)]MDO5647361.1 N-acetylmuramoyl-L-alanine amidase [Paracoccus sp. (in: a-proteobacteria)]